MRRNPETYFPEFEEEDCSPAVSFDHNAKVISVVQANRLLREEFEKWTVVYGQGEITGAWYNEKPNLDFTQQSRLMPPMPICKDTVEDVICNFPIEAAAHIPSIKEWYERAKRVLSEGK